MESYHEPSGVSQGCILFVCLFGDLRGGEISFVYLSMPSKLQLTPENAGPKKACSTNSHF